MRRRRSVMVAAAGVAVLVVAAAVTVPLAVLSRRGGSPAVAPSPGLRGTAAGPAELYRRALAATRTSDGVHYVAVTGAGVTVQRIVGDAGSDSGTQDITLASSFGTERFTLRLVNGTVYFQGNVPALADQLGVPSATAPGLTGSWIAVSKGDGPYAVVAPGITVADQATQMPLAVVSTRSLTGGVTRIAGRVPPHQGAPAGTGHLDVEDSTGLPVAYASTVSDGLVTLTNTTTFSAWGTAPSVSAPPGAVAWSTLGASPPPGGYGGGGGPGATPTPLTV